MGDMIGVPGVFRHGDLPHAIQSVDVNNCERLVEARSAPGGLHLIDLNLDGPAVRFEGDPGVVDRAVSVRVRRGGAALDLEVTPVELAFG